MLFGDACGCHRSDEIVREKLGNVTLSQIKCKSWKDVREKGNFNSVFFIYVHNVHTVHEIERQADVGFSRKPILFAHIVKELSIHVHLHVTC